jgi:hypothetical protein
MAFESAFILGELLAHHPPIEALPSLLRCFVTLRQVRTQGTCQRSKYMHDICQLPDGPEQLERDRVLQEDAPGDDFPNPWADPGFQDWLWGFDSQHAADTMWNDWLQTDGMQWVGGQESCPTAAGSKRKREIDGKTPSRNTKQRA